MWIMMLVLLPLIGVYRIGYYFWYNKQVIVKPLEGEWKSFGKCKRDVECVRTRNPDCTGCGCGSYVNFNRLGDYLDQLKDQCSGRGGGVCLNAVVCPQSTAACIGGYCVGKRI